MQDRRPSPGDDQRRADVVSTVAELAEREGIAPSDMTRVIMRWTLRAPNIVDAILNGRQRPKVALAQIVELFPADLGDQPDHFGFEPICESGR